MKTRNIEIEARRLLINKKIAGINSHSLDIEDYPGKYLDHLLVHYEYYQSIYNCIIEKAIIAADKPVNQLSVIDFGAGNGLLGISAKLYGFKKVWINDVSDIFLESSKTLAEKTGVEIDGFIKGNEKDVLNFFRVNNETPDILLATDVIEHIYDLENFFLVLHKINPQLIHVFTTGSNPFNLIKVRKLRRLQYKDEFIGHKNPGNNYDFHYKPSLSFIEQREKIISNDFPMLTAAEIKELAYKTRGKIKEDISSVVRNYIGTNNITAPYSDPYWVCDPETGSWTERVLPISFYRNIYKKNGFSFEMFNGFYNPYSNSKMKVLLVKLINAICLGNFFLGKYIAPFIIFLGKKNETNSIKADQLYNTNRRHNFRN